jgi:hypothetical protein
VIQRPDDSVLIERAGFLTAASRSLKPRKRPEHALPPVNLGPPG